jgi:hypothetical protein
MENDGERQSIIMPASQVLVYMWTRNIPAGHVETLYISQFSLSISRGNNNNNNRNKEEEEEE